MKMLVAKRFLQLFTYFWKYVKQGLNSLAKVILNYRHDISKLMSNFINQHISMF